MGFNRTRTAITGLIAGLTLVLSGCGASPPVITAKVHPHHLASLVSRWSLPLATGKTTLAMHTLINPLTSAPSSPYTALLRATLADPSMGVLSNWHGLTVPAVWITNGRTTFNVNMYRGITNNPSITTPVPVTPSRIHNLVLRIMRSHYMLLSRHSYTVVIQKISAKAAQNLTQTGSSMVENIDNNVNKPAYMVLWIGQSTLKKHVSSVKL